MARKIAVIASRLLARVKDEEGVEKEQKKRNTKTGLEMRGASKKKKRTKRKETKKLKQLQQQIAVITSRLEARVEDEGGVGWI